MKKNKLFTLVVVVTLGLGAAAPIAVAFADTGDITSQETEGPKSAQDWGIDVSAQEDLISKVTYAMNNPQLYTEESWNSFMYDNPGGMYMEDWVSTANHQMYQPVHSSITEAQEQMDAIISAITPLYQKLVLAPVEPVEPEPVEPVEPEVQYTTVTIELRGKEKGELLGLITLDNQEIGSEVEITPPAKEGFVTPPAFKVVVTEGFTTILYYQPENVEPVKPVEPTEPTDPDGENGDDKTPETPKPGETDGEDNKDDGEDKTPVAPKPEEEGDKTPAGENTNDGDNSDKGADTDKKESGKKADSKGEGEETPKPLEGNQEVKKADSKAKGDKLYTDASGLAKTSLSSENNNRSLIGLVVGIFAVLGGLVIAFKERITHKN